MTYRPVCDVWIMGRPRLRGGQKLYGRFPNGFVERARLLLGVNIADPVLHVCGGLVRFYAYPKRAVGPNDRTMDLNPMMEPDFIQDARKGPYPEGFKAILADPPYSEADAAFEAFKADVERLIASMQARLDGAAAAVAASERR